MFRQGFQMTHRRLVAFRCAASLISFALASGAHSAHAQQTAVPGDEQVTYSPPPPANPSVQEVAHPQVVEYETDGDQASQVDPRAKAAWLTECRRRAAMNGVRQNQDEREKSASVADAAKCGL
jgi:hypothetical protein